MPKTAFNRDGQLVRVDKVYQIEHGFIGWTYHPRLRRAVQIFIPVGDEQ